MTSATENHPCDMPIDFHASECPDYGSMDCPKTVPGSKCGVDMQYANELMQAKCRYYARKANITNCEKAVGR